MLTELKTGVRFMSNYVDRQTNRLMKGLCKKIPYVFSAKLDGLYTKDRSIGSHKTVC